MAMHNDVPNGRPNPYEMAVTQIEEAADEAAIAVNPKAVAAYKSGKTSAVQFLVGQVMKRTKGRAKPDVDSPLLVKKLEAS